MNLVEQAVAPLKIAAIEHAREQAVIQADRIYAELIKAEWNLDVAAPRGHSLKDGGYTYRQKNEKRSLFASLTLTVPSKDYRPHAPHFVQASDERRNSFIKEAGENAAFSFDLYSAKLTGKVGAVVRAAIDGKHLWQGSTLSVTTVDGVDQRWFTQQIVNCSKLGKLFNQFPTRKLK